MSYDDNLPPGVTPSMLPGCSKQDEKNERALSNFDNQEGWRHWIESSATVTEDFEIYCAAHFGILLIHSFIPAVGLDEIPTVDNLPQKFRKEWGKYLWSLPDNLLQVMIEAFVESNHDAFEGWVLS